MLPFKRSNMPTSSPFISVGQKMPEMQPTNGQNMCECLPKYLKIISGQYLSKLTARQVRVCDAVIMTGSGYFEK